LSHPSIHPSIHTNTHPSSIIMVVNALAPILAVGNKLPHLRTSMVSPVPATPPRHLLAPALLAHARKRQCEVGARGAGRREYVVLVQWVCGAGGVLEWEDLFRYGMLTCPPLSFFLGLLRLVFMG
jgi:hypothetical protein